MYEQKQIILDGEILGNNVVINRYFELIYKISPLIIKNFINIINDTDFVLKPVRIKKYDFAQNNCINIYFKNKISSGEIKLAYLLNKENKLIIDTYCLIITEGENKGYSVTKQNSNAKLKPKEKHQKEYKNYQSNEDFIDISSDKKNRTGLKYEEIEQIINKKIESIEPTIKDNEIISIENILKETFESNNNLETIDKTNETLEKEKIENIENNIDIKEQAKIFTETEKFAESQNETLDKINTKIENDKNSEDNQSKNIDTMEEENVVENYIAIKKEITYNKNETIETNNTISIEKIENFEQKELATQNSFENIINDVYSSNKILSKEINNITEMNFSKEAENENLHENLAEDNSFSTINLNNNDLVDVFETIHNFSNNYSEEEVSNELSKETCLNQINSKNNNTQKRYENAIKLNREEKIAIYQKILNGYDNQMTENKLNIFKDKIKSIQKDDSLTIEDVLDAQVELLVDNKSKAFRILDSNIKEDVIQIDDELFLSRDKIYTWGDVYVLEW